METTRHFVASVYVVNNGAVALHDHKKLDLWLAAGGHVDHKELPHESAIRECEEEMGLTPRLLDMGNGYASEWLDGAPSPADVLIEKIDIQNGNVYHKHVDMVFFATSETRDISPQGPDEVSSDAWEWFTKQELETKRGQEGFPDDVIDVSIDAIEAVEELDRN